MLRRVVFCCVFVFCVWGVKTQHCNAQRPKALKFSINSRRNATGNWISQVNVDRGGDTKDDGTWDIDIELTTTNCGDEESIFMSATVIAPPHEPVTTVSLTPPVGYQLLSGHGFRGYYKLHTDLKTWKRALSSCEQEGAHLAILNSEEEAMALSPLWDANPKILDGPGNNWAHVGFHDQYQEGQYVTIFNQSLTDIGYMEWLTGEPAGKGENCGVTFRRDNLIGDIYCDLKVPYFCELELQ